jgi:hypothetical protein
MTIQELFILSNQELRKVIDQIKDDQWQFEMPEGTTSHPSTLADAVRYHSYDDAWVPDVLDGKTKDEVGDKYESLLTISNDQILNNYDKYNEIASSKVREFNELEKMVRLSYGDFSAHDYLQHIIIFRGFRGYDVAKLIGIDTIMSPELVQGLWDELSPVAEQYRQMGVFPSAIEVAEDADLQVKLLALVGRK